MFSKELPNNRIAEHSRGNQTADKIPAPRGRAPSPRVRGRRTRRGETPPPHRRQRVPSLRESPPLHHPGESDPFPPQPLLRGHPLETHPAREGPPLIAFKQPPQFMSV